MVTGVTGQDGWYLCQLLREHGFEVFGLVRPGDSAAVPPEVSELAGDLRDEKSLAAALELVRPDHVYNLAGLSSVAASWHDPATTSEVNGTGVLRLLHAVREFADRTGVSPRVVQASSAEIFGRAPAPQNEQTPIAPISPYGVAKAAAHHAVRVYRQAGVDVRSAILYNHESPRRPPTFVTRRITQSAAHIKLGLIDSIALGNLDARRDWGFAGDYMAAMYLIAEHDVPDDFVVATGVSHTVAEFVAAAFAQVGIEDWQSRVTVDPALTRPADVSEQRGDAGKAHRELGWQPLVSFDELVGQMVEADLG
ncbi:MAG: GDP-mannose 4,6 dehydratase [Frankiales bacterium]|nr:GDP-mannose 4,6 dehydratase [Frankiales bacterium]